MAQTISIVVPVFNEEKQLPAFLKQCMEFPIDQVQIIFSDGGSLDKTLEILKDSRYEVIHSKQGRAKQMNAGAEAANGIYLLFLHVDVRWESGLLDHLKQLVKEDVSAATFRLSFDWNHWFLNLNARFSWLNYSCFQYGDQGLWIKYNLYKHLKGFNESLFFMEDQDLIRRIHRKSKMLKVPYSLVVSARKYKKYGAMRLQFFYISTYLKYRLGWNNKKLYESYQSFLISDQIDSSAKG